MSSSVISHKESQNCSIHVKDSQVTSPIESSEAVRRTSAPKKRKNTGAGFHKNAVSAIITLKYYWGGKDLKRNLSSGVSLSYRAETSFCSQLMEEKGERGKIAPRNWHPDQGQAWQLNNAGTNLSQVIMSWWDNASRFGHKQQLRAAESNAPLHAGEGSPRLIKNAVT